MQKYRTFFAISIWCFSLSKSNLCQLYCICPINYIIVIIIVFVYQYIPGCSTSQMPRAAFLAVFQQRAISYMEGIMIALASPHHLLILMLCLARLVVYRPVSSVCNDIAIGVDCVGFVAWAVWVKVDKMSPPL